MPPTNARIHVFNETFVNFTWEAPDKSAADVKYSVNVNSSFWNYHYNNTVNTTGIIIGPLTSGTKYDFQVQTFADEKELSTALNDTHTTGEILQL